MIRVKVPATCANLGAGFDCLALAVDVFLEVEMLPLPGAGVMVVTQGEGEATLPQNADNHIVKVLYSTLKKWVQPVPNGLSLRVKNPIPLERGMGSSAAATVAGILLASHLAGKEISSAEVVALAEQWEGHADNAAAAVYGGVVLTGLRQEEQPLVIPLPCGESTPAVLLGIPELRVSTEAARQALPQQVSIEDTVYTAARVGVAVYSWMSGQYQWLEQATSDVLHQPYRLKNIVCGERMLAQAKQIKGVYGAAISGSGPTLVALGNSSGLKELAPVWRSIWQQQGINCTMIQTTISLLGMQLLGE